MIRWPVGKKDELMCKDFLAQRGHIGLSNDAHYLMYVTDSLQLAWVVGFDHWVGSTCHLMMASNGRTLAPRSLAHVVFYYGFSVIRRSHMFCAVNSRNVRSIRIVRWTGFVEVHRAAGAHEEGGDLVFFQITPADWAKRGLRYGKKEHAASS